jgi:tetratricopeptide (TPR) repeat protein
MSRRSVAFFLISALSLASLSVGFAFSQEDAQRVDLKLPQLETSDDAPTTPATSSEPASDGTTGSDKGARASATTSADDDPELAELEAQANPLTLKAIDAYFDGDEDEAYALFKEVYDENPDSDPPGVLIAALHSRMGRFLEMRRSLEQSAEDYPSDPEAFLQLAGVDAQEGRFLETELLVERAERLIDEYLELHPDSTERVKYFKEEALATRAILAEKRGRYDAAAELTRQVIALNPENPQYYWNLGYLALKKKDYDAAESAFDEAAKRNSNLWSGWLQVLSALDRDDMVDEATARLETKTEEIEDATKTELAQLARLYLRWFKIEDALQIARKFEEENDVRNLDRWLLLGWLALYANNYVAAEKFFRNATIVDPSSFEASNGLALALLDQGNKEKLSQARAIAARNYRERPDSLEAATTYGWCLFLSGNTREADSIFQPLFDSGSMSATVAYYLAEIANVRGNPELSENLLELALSQKANFPKRAAALELKELVERQLKDPFKDDFDEPDFEEVEPEEF